MIETDRTATPDTVAARARFAKELAVRAGALARSYFLRRSELDIETKRTAHDLVSEADREVERTIRAAIAERYPNDALVGEEDGRTPGTSGYTWIIDPIDGTAPFLAGMPGWCVSIGLVDGQGPLVGAIEVPMLSETYLAARGQGATLNDRPIRVAGAQTLADGLVGIGANDRISNQSFGTFLAAFGDAGGAWVRYGSGALMLAWVAAGRLIAYLEPRMNVWDCIAAHCLIEEAGGRVRPFDLGEGIMTPAPVLGTSPGVFDALHTIGRLDDDAFWVPHATRG
ncbi:inositol monophosphatase family protein [Acidimangrovimonas sediminis]|uniref:inositol monophosphatase family protein n=1 Tax=Acidimangrovimonas sediminis TaxID=2056283 RepID=UPI000C80A6BF|nr:inositol monophosphatase family protein [Acidimangrovimonas sediminis]